MLLYSSNLFMLLLVLQVPLAVPCKCCSYSFQQALMATLAAADAMCFW
jgi:hypothetical protein